MTGPDAPQRSRRQLLLRWGLPVLAVLLAGGLLALVLPGEDDDPTAPEAATASAAPTAPAGVSPAEGADPTTTVPPEPATEQAAATVVARDGVPAAARTITAAAADFAAPAQWSDGASLRVTGTRQQITTGEGPGSRVGQPQTVFVLELSNGSSRSLDLGSVVAQAVYGADRVQASPLYDAETVDLSGTLAPRGTATAVYSFAIPEDQLGDVVLSVDVDGYRFPAVFTGAVPAG
ncbi:MAG: hypothetical protein JWP33_1932 [Blastococcus sp.]|nr:hypothetical protein [Blastococcus sp.]